MYSISPSSFSNLSSSFTFILTTLILRVLSSSTVATF
jgi:hypothetical protein